MLYDEDSDAVAMLRDLIAEYQTLRGSTIILRPKKYDGLGGIYQTLVSGMQVAPAAMPDLTLLRASELAQAVEAQIVRPVLLPFDDLFTSAAGLGRLQGDLYGVPYLLEIQHLAYRASQIEAAPPTLEGLTELGKPFLFPAKPNNGISAALLAQYVAAGGRTATLSGQPSLEREPLLRVLRAYDRAVEAQAVGVSTLDYSAAVEYWPLFMTAKINIVQIDSTTYLAERAGGMPLEGPSAVAVAPLPLPQGGETLSVIDGWMWVITTTDPSRQERALSVIAWLSDPKRAGALSQALGMLPARRSALTEWQDNPYAEFAASLLDLPAAPRPENIDGSVATALQDAYEAVLRGRLDPEAAADAAVGRFAQ